MGRPKLFERSAVLCDAIALFWNRGFKDTSLQDLEKATGVNKSGLYAEFRGKEDLFTAAVDQYVRTNSAMASLRQKPLGWSNIEGMMLTSQKCAGPKGCFIANSLREVSILPTKARKLIVEHLAEIREEILKNVKAGGSKLDPERAADLILNFNAGVCLQSNLGEVPDFEAQVKSFLELLRKK